MTGTMKTNYVPSFKNFDSFQWFYPQISLPFFILLVIRCWKISPRLHFILNKVCPFVSEFRESNEACLFVFQHIVCLNLLSSQLAYRRNMIEIVFRMVQFTINNGQILISPSSRDIYWQCKVLNPRQSQAFYLRKERGERKIDEIRFLLKFSHQCALKVIQKSHLLPENMKPLMAFKS